MANPKSTYEKKVKEVNRKIFTLQSKIKEHQIDFEKNGGGWEMVSDLGQIEGRLDEILESLKS